jgi:hypothetical protein
MSTALPCENAPIETLECENIMECVWPPALNKAQKSANDNSVDQCVAPSQDQIGTKYSVQHTGEDKHAGFTPLHPSQEKQQSADASRGERKALLAKDNNTVTVDCAALVPETDTEIRKYKREICNSNLGSDDRLSSHELAGDFALRYYLSGLFRNELVRSRQQRSRRRGYRS